MAIAAEFRSDFDLRESVARLQAATYRSGRLSRPAEAAVGVVTSMKVNLQRVLRNSYRPTPVPIFVGRFEQRAGGNRFSSPVHTPNAMLLASPALVPSLALAFSVTWIVQGWWRSRTDVDWLSGVIAEALQDTARLR